MVETYGASLAFIGGSLRRRKKDMSGKTFRRARAAAYSGKGKEKAYQSIRKRKIMEQIFHKITR